MARSLDRNFKPLELTTIEQYQAAIVSQPVTERSRLAPPSLPQIPLNETRNCLIYGVRIVGLTNKDTEGNISKESMHLYMLKFREADGTEKKDTVIANEDNPGMFIGKAVVVKNLMVKNFAGIERRVNNVINFLDVSQAQPIPQLTNAIPTN